MHTEYSFEWKHIAQNWQQLTSPWRPSKENLESFAKLIEESRKNDEALKVLVLGSTPEIRDLLAKHNFDVTIIDCNIEMMLAMTEIVEFENMNNEKWVKASWTDIPLRENYYDIVIGDYVTSQLAEKDLELMLESIKKVLKPEGKFITRVIFYNDETVEKLESIFQKYVHLEVTAQSVSDFAAELCISVIVKRENNYIFSLPELCNLLKPLRNISEYNFLIGKIDDIFNPYTKEWFYLDYTTTENILKKYFEIIGKEDEPTNSTLAKNTFIYNLIKK